MANTFLNTGIATNNPQANVEQVSNTQQPIQNNVNGTTGMQQPQTNQVSPITIPIQIQPQVAQTGQSQSSVLPNSNLQITNNQQTPNYNAPTPQNYQKSNTNNNVVDFNQIYSSYQSSFGNNPGTSNISTSGIKKTSIGTTIVTPTTNNLNSVQGQYQSAYSDTINSLISSMLNQMNNGFQYNPLEDNSLKVASEYAANSTLQSLAGSGVLNSSATSERVARIVSELIPQYEEKAHDRWIEYLGQLADTAQLVMNYDSQQFEYWKDAKNREFQEKEFEFEKQQKALENAWKRVDELGYVDNDASAILGVKVGTLSGEARQAKEQREFELQKMREQAQIEYQNNVALYKLKSELDLEQSKQLASYENNLKTQQSKELAEYEYTLANKYGTSKNSTNTISLSTYKDVINNRYANYDDITKKYTVTDNAGLWDYLTNEYVQNRISDNDYATLIAMYGVTEPTDQQRAQQERIKYLNSLGTGGVR